MLAISVPSEGSSWSGYLLALSLHGGERDHLSGVSSLRALIPIMRAPHSCLNYFPKVPPLNTITLGIRASI